MPLETGNTIASLNAAWPLGSDPKSQGDDHLRLLKNVFKNDVVAKSGDTMTGALTSKGFVKIEGSDAGGRAHIEFLDNTSTIRRGLFYYDTGLNELALLAYDDAGNNSKVYTIGSAIGTQDSNSILTQGDMDARYLQLSGGKVSGAVTVSQSILYIEGFSAGDNKPIRFVTNNETANFQAQINYVGSSDSLQFIVRDRNLAGGITYVFAHLDQNLGNNNVLRRVDGDARWGVASSRRFKEAIGTRNDFDAMSILDMLTPKAWTWGGDLSNGDERIGKRGYGLIAEEVEAVFPDAVRYQSTFAEDETTKTGERAHSLDPNALIAVLIEAVKDLNAKVEELQTQPEIPRTG